MYVTLSSNIINIETNTSMFYTQIVSSVLDKWFHLY